MSAQREDESEPGANQTEAPRPGDTERLEIEASLKMTPTPDQASDYVPPRTLPSITNHRTIETAPVKVDPELDPTRARTMLSLRRAAQQEREALRALGDKNPTRPQLPWILISLLVLLVALIYWLKAASETSTPPPLVPAQPKVGQGNEDSARKLKAAATPAVKESHQAREVPTTGSTTSAPSVASVVPKKATTQLPKTKTAQQKTAAEKKKVSEKGAPSSTPPARELWLE